MRKKDSQWVHHKGCLEVGKGLRHGCRRGLFYFFDQIEVKFYYFRHDAVGCRRGGGGVSTEGNGGVFIFPSFKTHNAFWFLGDTTRCQVL